MAEDFDHSDYWKAITLYGLNVATYKPALATCILKAAKTGTEHLKWQDLGRAFLKEYTNRLETNPMPQQTTVGRQTKLERIIRQIDLGKLDLGAAVELVEKDAFVDVVPRFHTIGSDKNFASNYFYETQFGNKLILKDSLLSLANDNFEELLNETGARWSLLEGAFAINHSNYNLSLANNIRDIYLKEGYDRKPLTGLRPFLAPYQGNTCFYCAQPMDEIAVDHVLPRQVINNDEVWNLVLAHAHCNQLKSDLLVGPHFIEKLILRNENIMGSNHPWKSKIQNQLGNSSAKRKSSLQKHYENVKIVLGLNYWGGVSGYNPESDPFFKKLITRLNGG